MKLNLNKCFGDDQMLRRVFSWLSRIGAAPKFGSRPIGWYQIHQCHCIDILKAMGITEPVMKQGKIFQRGKADTFITPNALFSDADKLSRS